MVAKPRKEDDPVYIALMVELRAEHKVELAAAIAWVRQASTESVAAIRYNLDENMNAATKSKSTTHELIIRFAQLGFEYAHRAMYDEDKSNG